MSPVSEVVAPHVQCFSGRQEGYVECGTTWHRLTAEDNARLHTGYNRDTREANLGIFVIPVPNGLSRIGFDLWRLDLQLRDSVVERLEKRWGQESDSLRSTLLRRVLHRTHFSKSFAKFEVRPERVEDWKAELDSVLSNPDSYEPISEYRDHKPQ